VKESYSAYHPYQLPKELIKRIAFRSISNSLTISSPKTRQCESMTDINCFIKGSPSIEVVPN
jgi:hypothetical protein